MINKLILIGNAGKDAEFKQLESGASVAKFSVATNESYKDKSGEWQTITEWHDVICWRAQAERAASQIKKGVSVYVEGKMTYRSWEDQNGTKRRNAEVVVNYFRVLTKRESSEAGVPEPQETNHIANGGQEDDDLPF